MDEASSSPFGFQLDEKDPRLFHHPQDRTITLKRGGGRPDLKLTVKLGHVDDAFRAVIVGYGVFLGDEADAQIRMSAEEWSEIRRLVVEFYGAVPMEPPTGSSQS